MRLKTALIRLGVMLAGMVVLVVIITLVQWRLDVAHAPAWLVGLVVTIAALAVYAAWMRFVERRRADELAPRAIPEAVAGLVVGFMIITIAVGIIALLGGYTVHGSGGWTGAATLLLPFVATGVTEELLFRGFIFRTVRDLGGTWIGVAVSALVFGALHAFNPGASVLSSVAIALEAGVLLALAYAVTDRLWLPIGIHIAWNFAEGPIFGAHVSGVNIRRSVMLGDFHGPAWLTGGAFGPEASVVAVAVCVLVSLALAALLVRRTRALA